MNRKRPIAWNWLKPSKNQKFIFFLRSLTWHQLAKPLYKSSEQILHLNLQCNGMCLGICVYLVSYGGLFMPALFIFHCIFLLFYWENFIRVFITYLFLFMFYYIFLLAYYCTFLFTFLNTICVLNTFQSIFYSQHQNIPKKIAL